VALVHGFGTGTDATTSWLLLLSAGCVALMLAVVVARVSSGWPAHLPVRASALAAAAVVPIGLVAWLPSGPLGSGWARRAGTPAALLAAVHGTVGAQTATTSTSSGPSMSTISGTVRQAQLSDGSALVDLQLTAAGGRLHTVHIRIRGRPVGGGGVQMTSSRVSAGPMANPDQYSGRVTALQGNTVQATVSDGGGTSFVVLAQLTLQPGSDAVTGSLTTTPTH
jgi:hypothetical protein